MDTGLMGILGIALVVIPLGLMGVLLMVHRELGPFSGLTSDSGIAAPGQPGVWRIPSLRNVALTGPYFHNGSVDKLGDAVRIKASAQLGIDVSSGAPSSPMPTIIWSVGQRQIGSVSRRVIGDREVDDMVAFLNALSSDALVSPARSRTP